MCWPWAGPWIAQEAEENFLREAKKIRGDKREVRSYHTVSKWSRTWWGCTTDAIAAADFNISSSCFSEWWNDEWWTCCRCWRSTPTNCRGPSSAGAGPISLGGSPSTDGSPPTAGEVPGGPHRGRSPFLAALRGGGHVSAQRLTFSFLDFSWGDEVQPVAAWDGWFCFSIAARQQGGVWVTWHYKSRSVTSPCPDVWLEWHGPCARMTFLLHSHLLQGWHTQIDRLVGSRKVACLRCFSFSPLGSSASNEIHRNALAPRKIGLQWMLNGIDWAKCHWR